MDLLRSMGLEFSGIVGYFVGELGCGYVDGFLIIEEIVLVVYWRGRCILEFNFFIGGMVVVGKIIGEGILRVKWKFFLNELNM